MRIKFDQRTKKASFKLGYTMKDTFANLNRMYVGKNKQVCETFRQRQQNKTGSSIYFYAIQLGKCASLFTPTC